VIYSTQGVKAGDKFRGALVADHADHIAPEKRNMIEAELTLDGDTDAGALSFKKPVGDWPVGDYHVEIYINDKLVATAKFTITPAN
jgi:outer membrane usher protein FimD/PapC